MRALLVAAGVTAVLSTGGAQAATVITMSQGGDATDGKTQAIYLDSDRLRIETKDGGGLIYRGDMNKAFVIDDKRHSYIEMSPESMQKLSARMNDAMAKMQQRMAAMPEAQRKQMEAMMGSHGMPSMDNAPAPPQITYKKTGDVMKVGSWNCVPYTMIMNGEAESNMCIAKLSDVGLTRDDLKPFIGLSNLMGKSMSQMGHQNTSPMAGTDLDTMTKAIGFEGFPVQSTSAGGPGGYNSTVQSVDHKDAPAGVFDLPAGYTKREMGGPAHSGGE